MMQNRRPLPAVTPFLLALLLLCLLLSAWVDPPIPDYGKPPVPPDDCEVIDHYATRYPLPPGAPERTLWYIEILCITPGWEGAR